LVRGIVAFRYDDLMTVPGKGGRPRKWRSDADRVRAHRARQRGEDEPATLEQAFVDGDELARAIDRGRQLQAELVAAIQSLAESDAALQSEHRRHTATQRKLDRERADLDAVRATLARQAEELRATHDELFELRADNSRLREQLVLAAQRAQQAGPNRAARRQAAKSDRRTGR
jgi:chromosome segregation ATPase